MEGLVPKKPTSPYGYINFGKDGSVEKVDRTLPADKAGQEKEVAARFAHGLSVSHGQDYRVELLDEAGHDARLIPLREGLLPVWLQIAELSFREWSVPLTENDWIEGTHGFSAITFLGDGKYCGIDEARRDHALARVVRGKLAKNYQKPNDAPLWLLVFTVAPGGVHFFWQEGGRARRAPAVDIAHMHLHIEGRGPFEQVWVQAGDSRPERIWPDLPSDG